MPDINGNPNLWIGTSEVIDEKNQPIHDGLASLAELIKNDDSDDADLARGALVYIHDTWHKIAQIAEINAMLADMYAAEKLGYKVPEEEAERLTELMLKEILNGDNANKTTDSNTPDNTIGDNLGL